MENNLRTSVYLILHCIIHQYPSSEAACLINPPSTKKWDQPN
jgi:hypothetical protein